MAEHDQLLLHQRLCVDVGAPFGAERVGNSTWVKSKTPAPGQPYRAGATVTLGVCEAELNLAVGAKVRLHSARSGDRCGVRPWANVVSSQLTQTTATVRPDSNTVARPWANRTATAFTVHLVGRDG